MRYSAKLPLCTGLQETYRLERYIYFNALKETFVIQCMARIHVTPQIECPA